MTFARDVEREVLYNAAKTMEEKGMPAEWAKALRDLIV
jgi:ABC-type histidine transport system ATPase subunit